MKQKGKFNYYPSEELRAHVVEFPYVGDDVSMMVILPPFDDAALFETVQKMTPATLRGVMAEVRSGFYEVRVAPYLNLFYRNLCNCYVTLKD